MYIYIYIYIYILNPQSRRAGDVTSEGLAEALVQDTICFCGLDPGNLKSETVRTNKQHICF